MITIDCYIEHLEQILQLVEHHPNGNEGHLTFLPKSHGNGQYSTGRLV